LEGLVTIDVELDEEKKIREKDALTNQPSFPTSRASFALWKLSCEVNPGEVKSNIGQELSNLQLGDVFLPEDSLTQNSEVVIVVHEGMYDGVGGGAQPLRSELNLKGVPAKNQSGRVMVDVKEDQRLLLQDQEESVQEFIVLAKIEKIDSKVVSTSLVFASMVTKHCLNATIRDHLLSFVEHEDGVNKRTERKEEIVCGDEVFEIEGFSILHKILTTIDNDEVEHAGDCWVFPGGERGDSFHPLEVIDGI